MILEDVKNKKVVIYGAGHIGRIAVFILRELLKDFDKQVLGATVSFLENSPRSLEGLAVRSLEEYESFGDSVTYVVAVKEIYVPQILAELKRRMIRNYVLFDYKEYIGLLEDKWRHTEGIKYDEFIKNMNRSMLTNEEYVSFLSRQIRTGALEFEINIADHCNLNCQCCNHFSPLARQKFLDGAVLEKNLLRMIELWGDRIEILNLLGGEPLLHPRLTELVGIARSCLPTTRINILSNGLMLPQMSEAFWMTLSKLNIGLDITRYPVAFDYDACANIARQYGIRLLFGTLPEGVKTTYRMPIADHPIFNPYQMYMKCAHANYCIVLRDDHIYNCSFAANVHHYNDYFHKQIPSGNKVSIDIYKVRSWQEIEEFLKLPNAMCSHCDICGYQYHIPWAVSRRHVSEWMQQPEELLSALV